MDVSVQFEKAKTGAEILILDGLYVHSKYNPINEAERIVELKYQPHKLHLIFGYGCGYVVEKLIEKCEFNEPILVLDPLIDNGVLQYKPVQYKRLYTHSANNLYSLQRLISSLISYDGNISLIENSNYKKVFPEIYKNILEVIRDAQTQEIININTIEMFSQEWQVNHFFNVENTLKSNSWDDITVSQAPIVIASGGPSLTKQLKAVEMFRDKIILICAGSTINTLLAYNIEPDYVVSIDGGEANYNHFKNLNLENAILIYCMLHHYKINESFKNDNSFAFVPSTKPHFQNYFQKRFKKEIPIINGGGSVAHFALSIAKRITEGPIALIGQDLAFTDNKTHAIGNRHLKEVDRSEHLLLEIPAYNGGMIKTSKSLKSMLDTFVQLQETDPHSDKVYNCTEGGAKIPNYEQVAFLSFLNEHALKNIESMSLIKSDIKNINLIDYRDKEIQQYKEILKHLKNGINLVKYEKGPYFNAKTLKKLNDIERKLNKLYSYLELNTLLEPTILKCEKKYLPTIKESQIEQFNRVKAYTEDLYTSCYNAIENYIEKIETIRGKQKEDENATK